MKKLFNIITNFIMGLLIWIFFILCVSIITTIIFALSKYLPSFITSNIGNIIMIICLFFIICGFISTTYEFGENLKSELIKKYKNRKDNK